MVDVSLQPCARRSQACQLEGKPSQAGQIRPNWGCSDKHAARSQEDKDTAGIPGHSARPLVGQVEEVRLLAVRRVIHVPWKTNALSVFPQPYCLPDVSLLNKETLSMETWVGRILWKPPSQMHNQASQHQPDEADLHLPGRRTERCKQAACTRIGAYVRVHPAAPEHSSSPNPKLTTLMLWFCVPCGPEPG